MSSYWEKTEKLNRRRRRWWTISAILTIAITAFYLSRRPFPETRSLEQTNEDRLRMLDRADDVPATTTPTPAGHSSNSDPKLALSTPATPAPAIEEPPAANFGPDASPKSGNTSNPVRSEPVATAEHEESDSAAAEAASLAAEEAAKELKRLREAMERARKSYQAELARQDQKLLEEFGGTEWADVRQQVELAEAAKQPQAAAERYNKATVLLKATIAGVLTRQTIASLDAKEYQTAFEQLHRLNQKFPDHAVIGTVRDRVAELPADVWSDLAYQEAKTAAPDDPGLAEMWLVVARVEEIRGRASESREASRRGWEAIERMTNVERAIESAIELIEHHRRTSDTGQLHKQLGVVISMCDSVSGPIRRAEYLADLAGLAKALGDDSLYDATLSKSIASSNPQGRKRPNYNADIMRCRALSWVAEPPDILAICQDIPTDKWVESSMCYGYAALAAARKHNQRAFLSAALRAESKLACVNAQTFAYPVVRWVLSRADVENRNWERAAIAGRNNLYPEFKGDILFSVLAGAPQSLDTDAVEEVLKHQADLRHSVTAVAGLTLHRLQLRNSAPDLIDWVSKLPTPSLRVAGYAAFAHAKHVGFSDKPAEKAQKPATPPTTEFRSLVETAERVARDIPDPLQQAFAWQLIAHTWSVADKPLSYQRACSECKRACRDAWKLIWKDQPSPKQSLKSNYYYQNRPSYYFNRSARDQTSETEAVARICNRLVSLAELQARLGDGLAAVETCLDAARSAEVCIEHLHKRWFFLRMQVVLKQSEFHTQIPSRTLTLDQNYGDKSYPVCLVAAWSEDSAELKKLLAAFEKERPFGREKDNQVSRVSAELALLMAKQGDVTAYRAARRKSLSLIDTKGAQPQIKLLLAEADARAGEFVLAENTLIGKPLVWYGPADRPRSVIIAGLAAAGRWEDAAKKLDHVSSSQPRWRLDAAFAIATARCKVEPAEATLDWVQSLKSPLDRVAGLCGLASASR